MSNKPTVKRSVLASNDFIAALMPVCGYMETGDVKLLANRVEAVAQHAGKKHERDFGECHVCNQNVEFMHTLPPQVSAVALENPNKRGLRTRLSSIIYHNAMKHKGQKKRSKRGDRNFYAVAVLFNTHKKQHPELYR
jgi:hypothetical protein